MTVQNKRKKSRKAKRKGDYGKNKGKTYNKKKKIEDPPENSPENNGISTDSDEFNLDKINLILDEFDRKQNLKDPTKEAAKAAAAANVEYIPIEEPEKKESETIEEVGNDPDEDPGPGPEPEKEPEEEDPFSLKDILTPDLVIDGLEWLSYQGIVFGCHKTGKIPMAKGVCGYNEKQRKLMRPGADKLLSKLKLKKLEDKPITAMLLVAGIHAVAVIAMSNKKPAEPKKG
jgi:hypothetical protein